MNVLKGHPPAGLNGRVAIITGAARGIGLAVAQQMQAYGARVLAWDLADADWPAEGLAGDGCVRFHGDVGEAADWERAISETQRAFGQADIVVNNAGIGGHVGSLLDYDDAVFDQVLRVNARGVYLGIKHGARAMREHGGNIVNISSVSGLGGGRFTIAYTASKHAVVGMTKLAAVELAPLGIRVNAVCPSPTATEMMFNLERTRSPDDPEAVRRAMSGLIPLGRYGEPDEIAAAVCFLVSDAAAFITGVALPVDGGMKAG